jgi:hypothetical protein
MSNMKKIVLGGLAVILLAGATPAFAQVAGTWAGTGEGACSPPPTIVTADFPIYAWQQWIGEIPDSEDKFYGTWEDETGNYGRFKGMITFGTPTEVACQGSWTWFNTKVDPPREYYMGTFWMRFHKEKLTCFGEWSTYFGNEGGTMEGGMVD